MHPRLAVDDLADTARGNSVPRTQPNERPAQRMKLSQFRNVLSGEFGEWMLLSSWPVPVTEVLVWLEEVLPPVVVPENAPDGWLGYIEPLSKLLLREVSSHVEPADLVNLLPAKLRFRVPLAAGATPFERHIEGVLGVGPDIQVMGIHASLVVAVVAHELSSRNVPFGDEA